MGIIPKCETETQSEQMLLEKKDGTDRLAQCRAGTNLQFIKKKTFKMHVWKHIDSVNLGIPV